MRCWDGGASFFTCKFGTYHLLDNITLHKSIDSKLVTTDYFSLAAPFVNYWNGDVCEIQDQYLRCQCGRLYRPFKMLENRPFALKGTTKLTQIKEEINKLDFKNNLVQVQFENLNVRISSDRELEKNEKTQLKKILKEYQITFC
jgi:phenylacetate-coenzyme A ligase PaaK-like adenylate-forming protein